MDTGRAGTIGGRSADAVLDKSFFFHHGLLPKKKILESIHAWVAPDYQNLAGGSLSSERSRARFTPSGTLANMGWALGATYDKALIIVKMSRMPGMFSMGLTVGFDAAPATSNLPKGYVAESIPFTSSGSRIEKADGAGAQTTLATETYHFNGVSNDVHSIAQALSVNGITGKINYFIKVGESSWWPVVPEQTDGTYATFKSAGIYMSANSLPGFFGGGIGIYAE